MMVMIPVDFNAMNEDSSVRLMPGSIDALKKAGLELREGTRMVITDGEIWAEATVCVRHGMWSADPVGAFHYIEEEVKSSPLDQPRTL